jgi:lactoylglutathione lyase
MFTSLFPIIATSDVPRALGFYRDLLGATVVYEFPGPDGTPAYVGLDIGSSHVGIGLEADLASVDRPRSMSVWVYADDCDEAVEHLRAAGVTVTEEAADQPWGERVARVLDPDGNEVIIGSRPAPAGQ